MRWKWKLCRGLLMVWAVAALACGAAASFGHAPGTAMPHDAGRVSPLSDLPDFLDLPDLSHFSRLPNLSKFIK